MLQYLDGLDGQLLIFLNSFHTIFFDSFMLLATKKFTWVPFYIALAYMLFRVRGWKQALIWLVAIGLIITLSDQICSHVIRPVVQRLRPCNDANPLSSLVILVDNYRAGGYSFPSCHAANSAALATIITILVRRTWARVLVWVWAVLHIYSRLYLAVHYPGDILVGMGIGVICALVVYYVFSFGIKNIPALRYEPASDKRIAKSSQTKILSCVSAPAFVPWVVFIATLLYISIVYWCK